MARPPKWRRLQRRPGARVFAPVGARLGEVEQVCLPFDELEALRLLHVEGVSQSDAGVQLGVSRSTVSRMARRAHRTVTEALVDGKELWIEGGPVTVVQLRSETTHVDDTAAFGERDPSRQGENMIVAVPYLQGIVSPHFGSTEAFLVAHAVDGKVETTSVFEMQGMQHNHAGIAGFLREQGVDVILAGGMGAPMQQALKGAGFEVLCGVAGPALEAVDAYLRGDLEYSDATCGHHHGGHDPAG